MAGWLAGSLAGRQAGRLADKQTGQASQADGFLVPRTVLLVAPSLFPTSIALTLPLPRLLSPPHPSVLAVNSIALSFSPFLSYSLPLLELRPRRAYR